MEVPGTRRTICHMARASKKTAATLESWAAGSDSDSDSDDDCREMMQQLRAAAKQAQNEVSKRSTARADADGGGEVDDDDDDRNPDDNHQDVNDGLQAAYELMEDFEQSGFCEVALGAPDADLAQQAALNEVDDMDNIEDDVNWTSQQVEETLHVEEESTKREESALNAAVRNKVVIRGQELVRAAAEAFAEGAIPEEASRAAALESTALLGNIEADTECEDEPNNDPAAFSRSPFADGDVAGTDIKTVRTDYPLKWQFLPQRVQSHAALQGAYGLYCQEQDQNAEAAIHCFCFLMEQALDVWKYEASMSLQSLASAAEARENAVLGKGNRNLSLVCVPLRSCGSDESSTLTAQFVHWQEAGVSGRPVQLDAENKVKALVCVGELRTPMRLSGAYIVHPDVGVAMQRARGYRNWQRPDMPPAMCRLKIMCDKALLLSASEDGEYESEECIDDAVGHPPQPQPDQRSNCVMCVQCARAPNWPFPGMLGRGRTLDCPCCLQPPVGPLDCGQLLIIMAITTITTILFSNLATKDQ